MNILQQMQGRSQAKTAGQHMTVDTLTVSKLNSESFEVTIIPHTLKLTNLVKLKSKDIVNVEFDMIGKYGIG